MAALLFGALIWASFAGSALAASGKLVKNGSFEKDSNGDGIPNGWTGHQLTPADKRVCKQSYAGNCSFKFVAGPTYRTIRQVISVNGNSGDYYTLSFWTKAKEVGTGLGTYSYEMYFNHVDGSSSGTGHEIEDGTTPWTQNQLIWPSDEAFNSITVTFRFSAYSGKAWFDKVSLVPSP